jgi:hypothetical protein
MTKESLKQTFLVLKIIIRIIKLGGELVFIDESFFLTKIAILKCGGKIKKKCILILKGKKS